MLIKQSNWILTIQNSDKEIKREAKNGQKCPKKI